MPQGLAKRWMDRMIEKKKKKERKNERKNWSDRVESAIWKDVTEMNQGNGKV